MGNTIRNNWTIFYDGVEKNTGSPAVGYESATKINRVMRYKFETPAAGASHLYVQILDIIPQTATKQDVCWFVGTDATSHADANGASSPYHGTVTFDSGYASCTIDANIVLLPNTTYYLWFFPAGTKGSYYEWNRATNNTLNLSGGAGLVYIDNGGNLEAYQAFIDNGESWDLCMPYEDNGQNWQPTT